jgi:hypothetical protein
MPSLTLSRAESLRGTNERLRYWFDCMITQRGQLTAATPDRITVLLSELSRAGAELRAQPIPATGTDPELDCELELYRRHVERLREILPSIHNQLLVERARLEAQRARVQSAAEWAQASRQTL